jgi:hypothetical protein
MQTEREAGSMVKHTCFITKRRKSEIVLLVSFIIAIAILFCELSKAADLASPRIVGSWQIYRDDDRPKGPIPKEIMSFWANGKLLISGDHPNKGYYRINGNHLEFLIKKGNRAIRANRRFELSDEELKFKNEKTGWVYYKRVSKQPEGEEPDLR